MRESGSASAQRIARGGLYLLLFVIPFSNAGIEILFPFLLVAWWVGWRRPEKRPDLRAPDATGRVVVLALLFYLGICTWSVFFSTKPLLSLIGLICKTLEYALFFLIAGDVADHPQAASRGIRALLCAAWLVLLYGFLQEWVIRHPVVEGIAKDPITHRSLEYIRMIGPYKNPNDLATFLMVVVLIVIAQLLDVPRRLWLAQWILGFLLLGALALTQSRGALLGFTVGLFLLLILTARHRQSWIGGGVALALTAAFLFFRRGQLWEMLTLSDVASVERRAMWKTAWSMIQHRPLVGVGLNAFMANYTIYAPNPNEWPAYAHNCFLQVAAETGLIGLAAFLGFLVALFTFYMKALKNSSATKALLSGLVAGLAAFLVQSVFDTNLYALRQATLFWTLAGMTLGLSRQCLRSG